MICRIVQRLNLDYDSEKDILNLYSGEKPTKQISNDYFVFGLNFDDSIIKMKINNASKILTKILGFPIKINLITNIEIYDHRKKDRSVLVNIEFSDIPKKSIQISDFKEIKL